ncbi:MAG TPA: Uma2 family endonuclease, partial [Blastocatellia bacterium]|nr:Uma2 family endonuclease [Blastocatellia bacterium]
MAAIVSPPEQRVVLRVSWETYERLLAEHEDTSGTRFAYNQGELEIMVVSFEHEQLNRLIADLFTVIAEEMNLDFENAGSTTFKREDLARGFEPDTCFYIQHAAQIRGKKRIDLATDPPPDLCIEIDITSPSMNKLPIYAGLGVPEVWRYDGSELTILSLEGGAYALRAESLAVPGLSSQVISGFIRESQSMRRTEWLRRVREWARSAREQS